MRAAVVRPDATVEHVHHVPVLPDSPGARAWSSSTPPPWPTAVLEVARAALADGGPVAGVGIANQRASTIVWDRATGEPGRPRASAGRTCAPSAPASSSRPRASGWPPTRRPPSWRPSSTRSTPTGRGPSGRALLRHGRHLGGLDPLGRRAGADALHVTDATNAAVTGAASTPRRIDWDEPLLETLRIPAPMLPTIVDSSGVVGAATALPGRAAHLRHRRRPAGLARRARAARCRAWPRPPSAPAGMLDQCIGPGRPGRRPARGGAGTFPIVAFRRRAGEVTWGIEAIMLSAGTCVEWLRDDLGIIADRRRVRRGGGAVRDTGRRLVRPGPARPRARRCGTSAPAAPSSASPGARDGPRSCGPCSRAWPTAAPTCSRRPRADSGYPIASLRVDGGMSANDVFVQALADAIGRPVEISPVLEATTLGAGLLAGLAVGTYAIDRRAGAAPSRPAERSNPEAATPDRAAARERWLAARAKAEATIPELSGISF